MTLVAAAERAIDAPAGDLYTYVADFKQHHPHILPSAFSDFTVEAGGIGIGTVTSSRFRVGGRTQLIRTRVTRAEPGRLVEEHVIDRPMSTSFTFAPSGTGTTVRIEDPLVAAARRGRPARAAVRSADDLEGLRRGAAQARGLCSAADSGRLRLSIRSHGRSRYLPLTNCNRLVTAQPRCRMRPSVAAAHGLGTARAHARPNPALPGRRMRCA